MISLTQQWDYNCQEQFYYIFLIKLLGISIISSSSVMGLTTIYLQRHFHFPLKTSNSDIEQWELIELIDLHDRSCCCDRALLSYNSQSWGEINQNISIKKIICDNEKIFRFGIQGSGIKYNAYALWANWTDVTNWVCSYIPITSVLIYDCIPEVSRHQGEWISWWYRFSCSHL